MQITSFNIRVYGIVLYQGCVLLTDEFRLGMKMAKFPGGGLEPGEGTHDCLRREFREETGQEIEILEHFYTTDYFQPTYLLSDTQQLLSIYYMVKLTEPGSIKASMKPFDFDHVVDGAQSFRWVSLNDLKPDNLTFPIDKKVAMMLRDNFLNKEM